MPASNSNALLAAGAAAAGAAAFAWYASRPKSSGAEEPTQNVRYLIVPPTNSQQAAADPAAAGVEDAGEKRGDGEPADVTGKFSQAWGRIVGAPLALNAHRSTRRIVYRDGQRDRARFVGFRTDERSGVWHLEAADTWVIIPWDQDPSKAPLLDPAYDGPARAIAGGVSAAQWYAELEGWAGPRGLQNGTLSHEARRWKNRADHGVHATQTRGIWPSGGELRDAALDSFPFLNRPARDAAADLGRTLVPQGARDSLGSLGSRIKRLFG